MKQFIANVPNARLQSNNKRPATRQDLAKALKPLLNDVEELKKREAMKERQTATINNDSNALSDELPECVFRRT